MLLGINDTVWEYGVNIPDDDSSDWSFNVIDYVGWLLSIYAIFFLRIGKGVKLVIFTKFYAPELDEFRLFFSEN